MELDDLKSTWAAANGNRNNKTINPERIQKTSRQKHKTGLWKITLSEIVGTAVCLAAAVFIASSFAKLDTPLLQGTGAAAILLLMLLPVISTISTKQWMTKGNISKPHAEALKDFAIQKIRFVKLQKINMTLCYLLLVTFIVLSAKIFGNNDLSNNNRFWLFSFTAGYIFLLFYARWVEKWHAKTLQQAEDLLNELPA